METASEGFSARAWASEAPRRPRNSEPLGVVVFREVHLDEERAVVDRKSVDVWVLKACMAGSYFFCTWT